MGSSNKDQKSTTTQTSGPPAWFTDQLKGLFSRATDVSETAYNPATQQQVAGFTNPQTQAFGQVQANQGNYQPYLNQAQGYAQAGAGPITANDIQARMSPYQQNVIDATQAQFDRSNQRQLNDVNADAAKRGAFYGSGRDVAQALTREAQANSQNPVIAGLYESGFNNAQSAAQADAARSLQASGVMSGLGGLQQQYGANDIGQLLASGGMQQALGQAQLDAGTANAQAQAQYPFDTTQWLAGILGGAGGLTGTTSKGTQTTPGPNMWSQLLGAGTAAAAALSDARLKDDIEEVGTTHDGQPIYRYRMKGSPQTQLGLLAQDVEQHRPEAVGERGGFKTVNYRTATDGAVSGGFAAGGSVAQPYDTRSYVPNIPLTPASTTPPPSLAQVSGAPSGGMSDVLQSYKQAQSALGGLGNLAKMATTETGPGGWETSVQPSGFGGWSNFLGNSFGFSGGGSVKGYDSGGFVESGDGDLMWARSPFETVEAVDQWAPQTQASPMAAISPTAAVSPQAPPPAAPEASGGFGFGLLPIPEKARMPLFAAGLGMMASKSPWVGTAIGEGGLAGLDTYQQQQKEAAAEAIRKQQVAAQAAALQQRAAETAERMKMDREQHAWTQKYQQAQMDRMQQKGTGRTPQQMTPDERAAVAEKYGMKPGTPEYTTFVVGGRMSNPPRQMPSIYDREQTKADIKRVEGLKEDAEAAEGMVSSLASLKAARGSTDAEGPWTGWAATQLGTDAAQRVNSVAEDVRLSLVAKTKGAVSDSEMRIFGQATPGMLMGDKAAEPVIQGMELAAKRIQERAKFFDIWNRSNGNLAGAPEAWSKFVKDKPVIIEDPKTRAYSFQPANVDAWQPYIVKAKEAGAGLLPDQAESAQPDGGGAQYSEGDILENADGERIMLQGNEWVAAP